MQRVSLKKLKYEPSTRYLKSLSRKKISTARIFTVGILFFAIWSLLMFFCCFRDPVPEIIEEVTYDFVINVFAWRRLNSLQRLCNSLLHADYGPHQTELYFYLDGDPSADVVQYVTAFRWPHGTKKVIQRETNLGLERNIATSCVTTLLPAADNRLCFFFEDDISVSPHYFRWTINQLRAGRNVTDPRLVGIALHGLRVNQFSRRKYFLEHGPRAVTYPPENMMDNITSGWTMFGGLIPHESFGSGIVMLQQPSSWGAVYFTKHWAAFQKHWDHRRSMDEHQAQAFELLNCMAQDWTNSWKRYMLEYMYLNGYYMAYPNYHNQTGLSTCHREKGEHTDKPISALTRWLFTTPLDLSGDTLMSGDMPKPRVFDMHLLPSNPEDLFIVGCAAKKVAGLHQDDCKFVHSKDTLKAVMDRRAPWVPEVTIFTTLKLDGGGPLTAPIRLALTALETLWPRVDVLVFASEVDCNTIRKHHYVRCASDAECTSASYHRPMVGCLFQSARAYPASAPVIAFSNSDIIHKDSFLPVIDVVRKKLNNFLIVGCRNDVEVQAKDGNFTEANSVPHSSWGIDYFILPKHSLLIDRIPQFLIGSTRFDNWILAEALIDRDISVVDVTEAHKAYHLYVGADSLKSSADREGSQYNALLAGSDFLLGNIDNANYIMSVNRSMHVKLSQEELMVKYQKLSPLWKLQFEAEKRSNFTMIFHSRESLTYIAALAHPAFATIAGQSVVDFLLMQELLSTTKLNLSVDNVLLCPGLILGRRGWTFEQLLSRVVEKKNVVPMPLSGSDRVLNDYNTSCWVGHSQNHSVLVVNNSNGMILDDENIKHTLSVHPEMLLLTYVPFQYLGSSQSFTKVGEKWRLKHNDSSALGTIFRLNHLCMYALDDENMELSDGWDSSNTNVKQDTAHHRPGIEAKKFIATMEEWAMNHPLVGVSFLCVNYSVFTNTSSI